MIAWLAGWWNWPFLIPFLVGMGLVGVALLGGGHGGGDHDVGHDVHHGVDHEADASPTFSSLFMSFLGVGKAPLSILLEVMLVSFGLIGMLVNAIAHDLLADYGMIAFPVALSSAIFGSMAVTHLVAKVFVKVAPANIPTSRKSGEFVGSTGFAATSITHVIGQVNITSTEKNAPTALINVCSDPEWPTEIPRGTEVQLLSYDNSKSLYLVRPLLTS